MIFQKDDGGRAAAGHAGKTKDCVIRAITIATGKPYDEVFFDLLREGCRERPRKDGGHCSSPEHGIHKKTWRKYIAGLGWKWVPTMGIGTGCRVHLRAEELPAGRLIVSVSRHMVAVIDGVLHDTMDTSRGGTRCVYGYFTRESA